MDTMETLDFYFLKQIEKYQKAFNKFELPVIITNLEFIVVYSNVSARTSHPLLTAADGLFAIISSLKKERVLAEISQNANFVISDSVALGDFRLALSPLYDDDGNLIAIIHFIYGPQDTQQYYLAAHSTPASDTLSTGIRSAADGIFRSLDILSQKADIAGEEWLYSHLEKISGYAYQTLRISKNITEFLRIQNGSMPIYPALINLTAWLEDSKDTLIGISKKVNIPLHIMIPHDDCFISADAKQLGSIIYNILNNAFYYTKENNQVFISVQPADTGTSVIIQDTGLGIPANIIKDVFKPYYTYSHGKYFGGAGLGLTISKKIAESFGGNIAIASEDGEGTRVTVTFKNCILNHGIELSQTDSDDPLDRFSDIYIGLAGIYESPFNPYTDN